MRKKEIVAMLLAGGQGSRLHLLTESVAKPAVPFGGKYRIIDFPLSNCVNSEIDTVGVLTQYQPLVLDKYIGNGAAWDLDRNNGGVMILPPYQASKKADWYKGTGNAIYQNLNFIKQYDPDYVLILSGDHIYKMDYRKMLEFHKKTKAACTIAVIEVPIEEASRFGIVLTNKKGEITAFQEKPKEPLSNKASMGIYIFNRDKLEKYLTEDEKDPSSENDFGKNIIPEMFNAGEKLMAYQFEGYWKDVGTLDSLWEANMDLLGEKPVFDLHDDKEKIYLRNTSLFPQFIGPNASIENSIITEGCEIYGTVINSVLSTGVVVEENAVVKDSVIMKNCRICDGATVMHSILDREVTVRECATVGSELSTGEPLTLLGKGAEVPLGYTVSSGEMLSQKDLTDQKDKEDKKEGL
ncbi:MAG: glucose-1-phosphate adenylyltransferase [Clostridia bacterium]|nr:glucose-1-phosphate adenylyltransferase [Clostridia bacterium]